jgi:hypothetical protein
MQLHKILAGLIAFSAGVIVLLLGGGGAPSPVAAQVFGTSTPLAVQGPTRPEQPVVHVVMFWMDGAHTA